MTAREKPRGLSFATMGQLLAGLQYTSYAKFYLAFGAYFKLAFGLQLF